jgi:hypothetical protein
MTELLVGTKKGMFVLEGEPGSRFDVAARAFAGQSVEYAMRDPRSGRYLASVTSWFYGPKIWITDDPAGEWEQAEGVELPEGGEEALKRIWVIVPGEAEGVVYAGGDPGVLFESRDGGLTWSLNEGLWSQPTRPNWSPGAGGLCLHTIAPWPGDPNRLLVAISAVGIWLSGDGGATWAHGNEGLVARYMPEESREGTLDLCVHDVRRAPGRPERLFMQFHDGDPDSAYVIPLTGSGDRVTPGGSVRVYETRDAGASWAARTDGLPQQDAYLTVLREAFDSAGNGKGLELYFGATSGHVFASGDAGATWSSAVEKLPPVYSVRAA